MHLPLPSARARHILHAVSQDDDEDYVPRRDVRLLVRFVLLFVLGLVAVFVGFDFLAGFRVGRYIAAGFGAVTDPGTSSDAGVSEAGQDLPDSAVVE